MPETIKIVYYYDGDQRLCPVQEYLVQFSVDRNDSQSTGARKLKLLADIDAKVDKQFILAQRYKEKFIFNPSRYEEYN